MLNALALVGFIIAAHALMALLLPIAGLLSVAFFVGLFAAGLRWALK